MDLPEHREARGVRAAGRTRRSVAAAVEQIFFLPVYAGPHPERWIRVHRALTRALLGRGALLEYAARLDGRALRIVCCGRPKRFEWLLSRLFDEASPGGRLGRSRTDDPRRLERLDADLLGVEVHPAHAQRFRDAGWMIVPETVCWQGRVSEIGRTVSSRKSRGLRSNLKRIRSLGYTIEEGGTAEDWRFFLDQMVVPYSRARFEDRMWTPTGAYARALRSRGRILFAVRDGRRVSAWCVVRRDHLLWAPLLGVRGGDTALLREGAVSALYGLVLEWARERGIETLHVGRSQPLSALGTAWHKGKWGFRAVPDQIAHRVAWRLGPGCDRIRERLASLGILLEHEEEVRPYGEGASGCAGQAPGSSGKGSSGAGSEGADGTLAGRSAACSADT